MALHVSAETASLSGPPAMPQSVQAAIKRQQHRLQTAEGFFLSVLRAEKSKIKELAGSLSSEAQFLAHRGYLLAGFPHGGRDKFSLWVFSRDIDPIHEDSIFVTASLPKGLNHIGD